MAYDSVDGDLTNRVVVEKTILDEEQQTAVVYYAVSDLSGNVTKQSRVFPADIADMKGIKEEKEEVNIYSGGFFAQDENKSENTESEAAGN